MAEQLANLCSTQTSGSGYTAGSGVLNVASTASPWPQSPTFTVMIGNVQHTILRVTAINSGTQWAVTAEANDADSASGVSVKGTIWSAAAAQQFQSDVVKRNVNIMTPNVLQLTSFSGTKNATFYATVKGTHLLQTCSKWTVLMRFLAHSVIGGIRVWKTLTGSSTIISTTTVTIGGASVNIDIPVAAFVETDPINLAVDRDHDYTVALYMADVSANDSGQQVANGGADNLFTGYNTGNHLSDGSIPTYAGYFTPTIITGMRNAD
jgi:hypothetical protein